MGLLAQTREQIDSAKYDLPRYTFAREMAHVWFNKLDTIAKEGGADAIEKLKEDFDGRTYVGEYIGSQEH